MNYSSVSGKNWIFKKYNYEEVKKISEQHFVNETVAKLLSIRKQNIDDISLFLDPKIKNLLPNPSHLKDMKIAIERTYKALCNHEKLGIFGDYDVDGATSTAVSYTHLTLPTKA